MIQPKYDFNKIAESAFFDELEKIGIFGSKDPWTHEGFTNFIRSSLGKSYGHTGPAKYFSGKLSNIETKKAAGGTLSIGEKLKRFGLKQIRSAADVTPLELPVVTALHGAGPLPLGAAYMAARPYAKKGILGLLSKFKK